MSDSFMGELDCRLRDLGQEVEAVLHRAEQVLEFEAHTASASGREREDGLGLILRDLTSAQALIQRISMARGGVLRRVLRVVLGRSPALAATGHLLQGQAEGTGLDPYRTRLAETALDTDRIVRSLSILRTAMAEREVRRAVDLPDWQETLLHRAGGKVDAALEILGEARDLLFGASGLTSGRPPSEHREESAAGLAT